MMAEPRHPSRPSRPSRHGRRPVWSRRRGRRRQRGFQAVEFSIILGFAMPMVYGMFEVARISLLDQVATLAASRAALAAGAAPLVCEAAAAAALDDRQGNRIFNWLADANENGRIAGDEVTLNVESDNDMADGLTLYAPGCGGVGSLIRVQARLTTGTGVWFNDVDRVYIGWGVHEP